MGSVERANKPSFTPKTKENTVNIFRINKNNGEIEFSSTIQKLSNKEAITAPKDLNKETKLTFLAFLAPFPTP
jgi:hypothetical protein